MGVVRALRRRLGPWAPHLAVTGVAAFFVLHAVHGEGGLLAYVRLQDQLERLEARRAELARERARLEHRVNLLQPGTLHPDMLAEQARRVLNYARPNEAVILLPGESGARTANDAPGRSQTARRVP